jgi:hypothetical protein
MLLPSSVLKMKVVGSSETSGTQYHTTRRHNPEDSSLHIDRRSNSRPASAVISLLPFPEGWLI